TADIVQTAVNYHKTYPVMTAALGRLLTATSMMGCVLKGDNSKITVKIDCDGEARGLVAVSDSKGNPKGYVLNRMVDVPEKHKGKLDVGTAIGKGTLFVSKDIGLKEPYNGATQLVSGEIAEDIAAYFVESEQIPTVCALGVLINPDLSINSAGGFIIQMLPAAGDDTAELIEKGLEGLPSVTTMLSEGTSILEIVKRVLCKFEVEVLEEHEINYKCDCSKERTDKILKSIGKEELLKLADEQEITKVDCHFCDKTYKYTSNDLKNLL
ncbi:MAG: Hsp33 family molecular chaperone HslO, partial [Clostridia bacterium]|nr:Hsp33 family molecular chaperone HslO [Clostridia bacterium]